LVRALEISLPPKRSEAAQGRPSEAMARSVIASGGPLLIGVVTASQKAGMAVLVLFFVAGLALLAQVREE
jgi:UMF1 family MFS transporter